MHGTPPAPAGGGRLNEDLGDRDFMPMTLAQLQEMIRRTYGAKDERRGIEGTFMWFMQEVGELATALRGGTDEERAHEFADVLAWLTTLANVAGVDLDAAVRRKYGTGCPGCGQTPCQCDHAEKP
jgi:NTP pyrophosphatase (non-canonical NTP hydrolase)